MRRLAMSVALFIVSQLAFCSSLGKNPNKCNQIYVPSVANLSCEYLYEKGSKISSSLKFITNNFIEYENIDDMIYKINKFIHSS